MKITAVSFCFALTSLFTTAVLGQDQGCALDVEEELSSGRAEVQL